MSSVNPYTDL